MIHESREGIEKRGQAIRVRAARFTYEALAGFVQSHETALSATRDCPRDIESRRKLGTTRYEKCFYRRHLRLDAIYHDTKHLNTREEHGFLGPRDFRLQCEEVVLHIMQNDFYCALLGDEVFRTPYLAPPDKRIQFIKHPQALKYRTCLGSPLPRARIKKFRAAAVALTGKKYHTTTIPKGGGKYCLTKIAAPCNSHVPGSSLFAGGTIDGMDIFIYIIGLVAFLALFGIRIIDQYDRGVILTLGKYTGTRQPGLTWIFPGVQRMIKIDLRITTTDIPQQEVITKDNVPVGINAVVYFQVESAEKAILNIKDYTLAVSQYAQAALRDVSGGIELDSILSEREQIAEEIQKIVGAATREWGINVTDIKIQDIELPADMKRVMAKQAESERERRAIIIRAEGEFQASERLAQAATVLTGAPGGIAMRTLQTIEKINPDPSKTVIFALPVEFMEGIKSLASFMKDKA